MTAQPQRAHVVASKAGLYGLIRALALGPYNIRANLIALGMIENVRANPEWYGGQGGYSEEEIAGMPLKRVGKPQEVANVAVFLASDQSSFVTGDRVVCAGGKYIESTSNVSLSCRVRAGRDDVSNARHDPRTGNRTAPAWLVVLFHPTKEIDMRKPFFSVLALSIVAVAATGCVTHEDRPATTAQQARGASDDRAVQINGTIVRQRSGDHYIVNDGTSDVLVEIKDHVRLGKRLEPGMKLQINGEIEGRTLRDSKVEARSVTVVP